MATPYSLAADIQAHHGCQTPASPAWITRTLAAHGVDYTIKAGSIITVGCCQTADGVWIDDDVTGLSSRQLMLWLGY